MSLKGKHKKFFIQKQVINRYRYLFAPDISYQDALHDIFRILDCAGPPSEVESFSGGRLLLYSHTDSGGVKYALKVDPEPKENSDRWHVISIAPPHAQWIPVGAGREDEFGIRQRGAVESTVPFQKREY